MDCPYSIIFRLYFILFLLGLPFLGIVAQPMGYHDEHHYSYEEDIPIHHYEYPKEDHYDEHHNYYDPSDIVYSDKRHDFDVHHSTGYDHMFDDDDLHTHRSYHNEYHTPHYEIYKGDSDYYAQYSYAHRGMNTYDLEQAEIQACIYQQQHRKSPSCHNHHYIYSSDVMHKHGSLPAVDKAATTICIDREQSSDQTQTTFRSVKSKYYFY